MNDTPAKPPSVRPASPDEAGGIAHWCADHLSERQPDASGSGRLAESVADGCTLLAKTRGTLRGVVALDLASGTVCALAFRDARARRHLLADLLTAIERLAVRFGFDEITLSAPIQRASVYARHGYRLPAGPIPPNALLRRSLARRQTRLSRRIRAINAELGIPGDYAGTCSAASNIWRRPPPGPLARSRRRQQRME